MKIFTAKVGCDDGCIYTVDAIDTKENFALVPNWLDTKGGRRDHASSINSF